MLSENKQKALIEAILFLSTKPVSMGRLVSKLKQANKKSEEVELEPDVATVIESENVNEEDVDVIKDALKAAYEATTIPQEENEEIQEEQPVEENAMQQLLEKQQELDSEITSTDVRKYIEAIDADLKQEDRGLELVTVAKGYQIRTKYDIAEFLKDEKVQTPSRFSPSSLEALAIVAYQQPITRQKIESIRGVDSGGVMKTLLDKNILRVVGRSDEPGKPLIYGTSKKFLEVFGLKNIKELPSLQDYESLQLAQNGERFAQGHDDHSDDKIEIADLIDANPALEEADKEIIVDLDESLKHLKTVEKEIFGTENKTDEQRADPENNSN